MRADVALGTCVVILSTATSLSLHPRAQAPVAVGERQGQRPPAIAATVDNPCVIERNSWPCTTYRLDQFERRLTEIEASIRELQSRPGRVTAAGPPIEGLSEEKADASSEYLQQRIDEIAKVVTQLVRRVNAL